MVVVTVDSVTYSGDHSVLERMEPMRLEEEREHIPRKIHHECFFLCSACLCSMNQEEKWTLLKSCVQRRK
jgi:hypothetical protein